MQKTICELFAGVGGFRLGFDRLHSGWETVWFSQWEPGKKKQWAHDCYAQHFGDCQDINGEYHTGEDICTVDKRTIPDHTLLVGGFPCQDYSVANTLATSKGIEGKKGVLWWQIRDVLEEKRPPFCILENVDRLLKSPAKQRGRDFGIILSCFYALGYGVEWRVVNAANYGAPQRRKRVFLFAFRNDTQYYQEIKKEHPILAIRNQSLMAQAFPIELITFPIDSITLPIDLTASDASIANVSKYFSYSKFREAGYMLDGRVYGLDVIDLLEKCSPLGTVLQTDVDSKYYISEDKLSKWAYQKGAKRIDRTSATGHHYVFSEGSMAFPDPLDRPGRTMLTSEATLNRSSHVIVDPQTSRMRVLTPVEAERLNGFDDDWTNTGMPERMRYFCMGNALVVPMITRIGKVLDFIIENEK